MSFFYLGNRVTPNIRVGSCSTRRLDDGGRGGGAVSNYEKAARIFPKGNLGFPMLNDPPMTQDLPTRRRRD